MAITACSLLDRGCAGAMVGVTSSMLKRCSAGAVLAAVAAGGTAAAAAARHTAAICVRHCLLGGCAGPGCCVACECCCPSAACAPLRVSCWAEGSSHTLRCSGTPVLLTSLHKLLLIVVVKAHRLRRETLPCLLLRSAVAAACALQLRQDLPCRLCCGARVLFLKSARTYCCTTESIRCLGNLSPACGDGLSNGRPSASYVLKRSSQMEKGHQSKRCLAQHAAAVLCTGLCRCKSAGWQ